MAFTRPLFFLFSQGQSPYPKLPSYISPLQARESDYTSDGLAKIP
jgi:hypothetical protein